VGPIQLGQRIRDFRKERGIRLTDLAGRLDISPSFLSAVERNIRNPSVSMLKKISEELNISVAYLVGDTDDAVTGEKLRLIRESRGLSAEDLAEISDLPMVTLRKFENGEAAPGLDELKKLSAALNVTIGYFLAGENANQLGRRVHQLRTMQGLTATALADRAGVTSGLVSQIENGQTMPSLETLESLARELCTSVGYLLMERQNVEDLVAGLSSDVLETLGDPKVQSVLRAAREFSDADFRFIISFIELFKQNRLIQQ
jgi:transcriptional regulator with XRE-family HTH domain